MIIVDYFYLYVASPYVIIGALMDRESSGGSRKDGALMIGSPR
jgi:hypothetical protein